MNWSAKELRLTPVQATYLARQDASVHHKVNDRTELILSSRKMLAWKRDRTGEWHLERSPKGEAALAKFYEREKR
jgi:hypothetical protein